MQYFLSEVLREILKAETKLHACNMATLLALASLRMRLRLSVLGKISKRFKTSHGRKLRGHIHGMIARSAGGSLILLWKKRRCS